MTKEVRWLGLFIALAAIMISNGCGHKPAYSDIDANKAASSRNPNSGSAGTTPAPSTADLPAGVSQAAGSPPSDQRFKSPSFVDQATGGIKDLPNYPRSSRASIQVGPNQGFDTMALVLQTGDSMDRITAFYQKTIQDNRWTIVEKVIDPDLSEWTLKKGEVDNAKIEVKKDPTTSKMKISILRAEKLAESSK